MADKETINIVETPSGGFRAILQHGKVEISCANDSPDVVNDTVRNIIRLVAEAVDQGWFRGDAHTIGVLGSVHNSTGGHRDDKHLTVTVKPGGKAKHLYLLPNNEEKTILDTTTLDTSKPPGQ